MSTSGSLPEAWFARDAPIVAVELLNKLLVVGECRGCIIEVEAYTADDAASHSHHGPTNRNAVMFGPAGRLYVYFTYGMHWCANVVTGADGDGQAVLLRAVSPLSGVQLMRTRRAGRPDRELTNGPAKLAQAFGIDGALNGSELGTGGVAVVDDGVAPPSHPLVTPRVGITKAIDLPRRWLVPRTTAMPER